MRKYNTDIENTNPTLTTTHILWTRYPICWRVLHWCALLRSHVHTFAVYNCHNCRGVESQSKSLIWRRLRLLGPICLIWTSV